MIDPDTYGKFLEAEQQAQQWGLSLVEMLDRRRLLLTPERYHQIGVTAVEDLVRRFSRQTPNKIMSFCYGRVEGTPEDMFRAVGIWLEAVARNFANKTLGDL